MPNQFVFWEVDAQEDFMLPGGKLHVPGAEKIIPNIQCLVQTALTSHTLLVSSACAHLPNDPEFQTFPPHCIKGTQGAKIIAEGMSPQFITIPNDPAYNLSATILDSRQIVIEKQMLDVFTNPHTATLVEKIGSVAQFVVFGVVTEYCVKCASQGLLDRGRKVFIVQDAIETLAAEESRRTLEALAASGAQLISTNDAIALVA